jgi:hypothetical protein
VMFISQTRHTVRGSEDRAELHRKWRQRRNSKRGLKPGFRLRQCRWRLVSVYQLYTESA